MIVVRIDGLVRVPEYRQVWPRYTPFAVSIEQLCCNAISVAAACPGSGVAHAWVVGNVQPYAVNLAAPQPAGVMVNAVVRVGNSANVAGDNLIKRRA